MPKFQIVYATVGSLSHKEGTEVVIVGGFPNETTVHHVKKVRLEPADYYIAAHKIVTNAFMAEEVGASLTAESTMEYLAIGNLFAEIREDKGWRPIVDSSINLGDLLQTMHDDPTQDPSWAGFKFMPQLLG